MTAYTVAVKRGEVEEVSPMSPSARAARRATWSRWSNRESKIVRVAERDATGTLVERARPSAIRTRVSRRRGPQARRRRRCQR